MSADHTVPQGADKTETVDVRFRVEQWVRDDTGVHLWKHSIITDPRIVGQVHALWHDPDGPRHPYVQVTTLRRAVAS